MGVLGYKMLTITPQYTDKKKRCTPLFAREVHPIFYGLSILLQVLSIQT